MRPRAHEVLEQQRRALRIVGKHAGDRGDCRAIRAGNEAGRNVGTWAATHTHKLGREKKPGGTAVSFVVSKTSLTERAKYT